MTYREAINTFTEPAMLDLPEDTCPDCGRDCRDEDECAYNRASRSWLNMADIVDPGNDDYSEECPF